MRDDTERLRDILEAIQRVQKYAARGRSDFERDELLQTWVVHHVQIIGEASRKLSDGFKQRYSHLPWRQIIAMRNILVHDYFSVDRDEVWAAVEHDLPELKRKIEAILKEIDEQV